MSESENGYGSPVSRVMTEKTILTSEVPLRPFRGVWKERGRRAITLVAGVAMRRHRRVARVRARGRQIPGIRGVRVAASAILFGIMIGARARSLVTFGTGTSGYPVCIVLETKNSKNGAFRFVAGDTILRTEMV